MVDHINNGESGLSVREKLNEVIDRTNTLNGSENQIEANKNLGQQNSARIDKEIQDRIDGDNALDARVDKEIADRKAADQANQNQSDARIDQEIQDRIDGDNELWDHVNDVEDQLENLDVSVLDDKIDKEIQDRIDGDANLQGQIDGLDLGGAIDEAPEDGKLYARKDASWSEIVPDAPSLLYGSWSYNSSSATTGSFTTRNANWFTATTLTLHKNDTSGYEHSFDLMTEGDLIVLQAPSGGAEYRVISKTVYANFCDFVVDVISAFGSFPSNGYSVDFNFVPQTSSGAGMVISSDEPVDPVEGMQWLDSTTAEVWIWDGERWLEFPAGSGGSGGSSLWEQNGDDIYYSDGNVGVGTDSPESKMNIIGDVNLGSNSDIGLDLMRVVSKVPDPQNHGYIATANNGAGGVNGDLLIAARTTGASNIRFLGGTNNTQEFIRINAQGKVGIGTDDPQALLEVKGNNASARFRGAGSQLINFNFSDNPNTAELDVRNAGNFYISKQGTPVITINNDNNVGIGVDPARSTFDLSAKEQLAEWKTKAKKASWPIVTDGAFEQEPTEDLVSQWIETRVAGAKLQVAGNISASSYLLNPGSASAYGVLGSTRMEVFDTANKQLAFYAGTKLVSTFKADGSVNFSGPVNAEEVFIGGATGARTVWEKTGNYGWSAGVDNTSYFYINGGGVADDAMRIEPNTNSVNFSGTVTTSQDSSFRVESSSFYGPMNLVHNGIQVDAKPTGNPYPNEWDVSDSILLSSYNTGVILPGGGQQMKVAWIVDRNMKVEGDLLAGTVSDSSGPLMSKRGLISTLSTLRNATKDETTLEGLRDSIGNAIGGLIERFEAEIATMPAAEASTMEIPE